MKSSKITHEEENVLRTTPRAKRTTPLAFAKNMQSGLGLAQKHVKVTKRDAGFVKARQVAAKRTLRVIQEVD